MKKNDFLCVGWLPTLLCSLLFLVITAGIKSRDIERKVQASAISVLPAHTLSWAKIETYNLGRSVLLTGAAPNQGAIQEALDLIGQAPGVLNVRHNGEAFANVALPPTLKISMNDKVATMSGSVANQAEIDRLIKQAKLAFSNHEITHSLNIGYNVAELTNINFLSSLNTNSQIPYQITADLRKSRLYLTGSVGQANIGSNIETKLRKTFSNEISNKIKVDRSLCTNLISESLSQGEINFESGQSIISPISFALLDNTVIAAARCPDINYEVTGHTDGTGNEAFNIRLSDQRAQSVINYLVQKGLKPTRFNAKGYGSNKPIADNATTEGRAQNRRIEFKISN